MKRFFALLALVVLSLGLMGASAAAQENATANETTNETGPEIPPQVESILENVDPEDAPDSYVEIVRDWADGRLEDAGQSERERVESWLEEAEGQLGDRDDRGGDRSEDQLGNATEVGQSEVDTLEKTRMVRFSDSARIVGWEFTDGRVRVAVQTDVTTEVTVSDSLAGLEEEGAVTVPETSQSLERGTHIVTLPVQEVKNGYGAAVTTNGGTVRLSSGMAGSGENPLQYFGGSSGVFAGIGLTIVMSGLAAVFVVWREESGVIEA